MQDRLQAGSTYRRLAMEYPTRKSLSQAAGGSMQHMRQPRAGALRRGRVSLGQQVYLVTTCTHERMPLLHSWPTARAVVHEMRHLHEAAWVASLAFVIMPDHLHWLFRLEAASLERVMACLKGRSARTINAHLQRHGPVWQRGYHDRALRHDEAMRPIARYLVANPLRAGLVNDIGEYPYWDAAWL
jgi:putative transposase